VINFNLSLGVIVLPGGQQIEVDPDYATVPHSDAGVDGLPPGVTPVGIGNGRYKIAFPDGIILIVWHALPGQECMLEIINPNGGILVISRKGIQGIGIEVQVRVLADGALGFRVLPDGTDGVQYLHSGVARPLHGVVQVALSNGSSITYRCGRSGDDGGEDTPDDVPAPCTFTCEERGQCSI
jgi:hypothetical protein